MNAGKKEDSKGGSGMFWDRVAGVYDLFANVYNGKVHKRLKSIVECRISAADSVLECACGTGMLTKVVAPRCRKIVATDFSKKMLEQTLKKCRHYRNVKVMQADILDLGFEDESFDVVIAANVIHLLDEPLRALSELDRVCRKDGLIIIPTYMNKEKNGEASAFSKTVGKAGADFKREFTYPSYRQFFEEAGYEDARFEMIEGRVPCAVAFLKKKGM